MPALEKVMVSVSDRMRSAAKTEDLSQSSVSRARHLFQRVTEKLRAG